MNTAPATEPLEADELTPQWRLLAALCNTMMSEQGKEEMVRRISQAPSASEQQSGVLMPDPIGLGLLVVLTRIEQQARITAKNSEELAAFWQILRQSFEAGLTESRS